MKEIKLTRNQVALVDDCDFERLNQFKWCAAKIQNTFYAVRSSPMVNYERHQVWMHHEVIGIPLNKLVTDHRDGNGLNNQRNNLRHVTRRQNGQNKKGYKGTSKYPGVHWNKNRNKWHVQIEINGKNKYLGLFTDEKEAFEAYKQAVINLGEEVVGEK